MLYTFVLFDTFYLNVVNILYNLKLRVRCLFNYTEMIFFMKKYLFQAVGTLYT
jgi:hypothetical protein